jgi:hypothetical protein
MPTIESPVLTARRWIRLPSVFGWREYVEAGGLMAYGPSRVETARRLAMYVDKILKGAKPTDLPVEQSHQVRACDQPQDGQGARPHNSEVLAVASGSGH